MRVLKGHSIWKVKNHIVKSRSAGLNKGHKVQRKIEQAQTQPVHRHPTKQTKSMHGLIQEAHSSTPYKQGSWEWVKVSKDKLVFKSNQENVGDTHLWQENTRGTRYCQS